MYFDLYESNDTSATPDLAVGPVAPSDDGVVATVAELAAGSWTIVVRFDQSNGYFTGGADQGVTIDVGDEPQQPGHVAKGIGWVSVQSGREHRGPDHGHKHLGSHGRFCFVYGAAGDGDVWGNASYSFRDSNGALYVFRSGQINRASFVAGQTGTVSTAKGMGNVWVRDSANSRHRQGHSHKHLSSLGRVWFRMDVVDGSSHSTDRFALSLWKDGGLWHRVGNPGDPSRVLLGRIRIF